MAQRRDVAVVKFSESLADSGAASFQPRYLCFGSFVELPARYGVAENVLDIY